MKQKHLVGGTSKEVPPNLVSYQVCCWRMGELKVADP